MDIIEPVLIGYAANDHAGLALKVEVVVAPERQLVLDCVRGLF